MLLGDFDFSEFWDESNYAFENWSTKMNTLIAAMTLVVLASSLPAGAQSVELRPEEIAFNLTIGFTAKESGPLREFLCDWHVASKSIPAKSLAKKQAVYALYAACFVPEAVRVDAEYLIIQADIEVHLVEADLVKAYHEELRTYEEVAEQLPAVSKFTIHSFRPKVPIVEKKVLYYNRPYVFGMLQFLTGKERYFDEEYWAESNGHDDPTDDKHKKRRDRLEYLNKLLRIIPRLGGNGWHIATHPKVQCLVLSTELDAAVVYSHYGGRGGIALLQFREGNWAVFGRERTWVE